jgi:hypothetical protein
MYIGIFLLQIVCGLDISQFFYLVIYLVLMIFIELRSHYCFDALTASCATLYCIVATWRLTTSCRLIVPHTLLTTFF